MKITQTLFLLFCCCLLWNCSSSRLLSSTSDASFEQKPISPILVVGISSDETKRHIYENTFVDSLNSLNAKAIASHTVSKQSIEPDEKALRAVIKKTGANTILITHMVSADEKDFYHPSNLAIGTNSYSKGLFDYYPYIYRSAYSPGSYAATTKVTLETSLYDVTTEKPIWTARSESIDPVMTRKYYQQLIDLFLTDLRSKKLL